MNANIKQALMVKYFFISLLLVITFLGLLTLPVDRANADSPDPTPTPGINTRTKLQPHQSSDVKPAGSKVFLFKETPGQSGLQEAAISALAQQTFYAAADANNLQGYPNLNFGDVIDMWAGYDDYLNPDGMIVRSLVKFNINSLPANQVITKATLRVNLIGYYDYPNTYRTITTYRVTSNWSEGNVTWNNLPGYGAAYGSKSIRTEDLGWHEFNVTNLVKAWYDGAYPNYGIMLRGPEYSGLDSSWRAFSTREGPFPPELVVEYTKIPNPPNPLTATPLSQTQIRLNWANSDTEDGFKIERSPNGSAGWIQIANMAANITTYTNIGLACGTPYYYRVQAYNVAGSSTSNTANATTSVCAPPSNLTATAISASQIDLAWQDNSQGESGFKVEQSPNGSSDWVQITTVGSNVTGYANTGLMCDTFYYYRVRAYSGANDSSYTNIANAVTFVCPVFPPSNLTATAVSTDQINLVWQDNSDNETGFTVERSANGQTGWGQIALLGADAKSYLDINLTCGTTYHYRVKAYNSFVNSDYSNPASATLPPCSSDSNQKVFLPIILLSKLVVN